MFEQIQSATHMMSRAQELKKQGLRIGFVPTMGFLHEGHLSLIRVAKSNCDVVVVSIFVNPTQFGPNEDLSTYPRDTAGDVAKIKDAGAHIVFLPSINDIYDGGPSVSVAVPSLADRLCGRSRPHHFGGVCQVVLKLFGITQCDVAVFGQKDFQQLAIIKRMVRDLFVNVEILGAPIVRTPSGLALSSRNVYLSAPELEQAAYIYQALCNARRSLEQGNTNVEKLKAKIRVEIESQAAVECEYIEILDETDLSPLSTLAACSSARAFVAVRVGSTRLIDNLCLSSNEVG